MSTQLSPQLRERIENTIRFLAVDAVQAARSGHPGAPMGLARAALLLWDRTLRFDPSDPHWVHRDRFVLSNGHASMLQYALLHLFGYGLDLEQIKRFRQLRRSASHIAWLSGSPLRPGSLWVRTSSRYEVPKCDTYVSSARNPHS